jgi:hypothetical protein
MTGSSILPVAYHKGKLYFLFGKETPLEKSAPGFSDFGGGMEPGESPMETALREGGEELTGFLGDDSQIHKYIKSVGGHYKISHVDPSTKKPAYITHIIPFNYDPMLPFYFNNNHKFIWDRMNHEILKSTKIFEKIEIEWFCETDLKRRMSEYRPFYCQIVKLIIDDLSRIRTFIKKRHKRSRRRVIIKGRRKRTQRGG